MMTDNKSWCVVEYPLTDENVISRVIGPFNYDPGEFIDGDKPFPDAEWIEKNRREGYGYDDFALESP